MPLTTTEIHSDSEGHFLIHTTNSITILCQEGHKSIQVVSPNASFILLISEQNFLNLLHQQLISSLPMSTFDTYVWTQSFNSTILSFSHKTYIEFNHT